MHSQQVPVRLRLVTAPIEASLRLRWLAAAGLFLGCLGASGSTITVSSERLQTIKGWGVFPSYHRLSEWGDEASVTKRDDIPGSTSKNNILTALYRDLGASIIRVDLAPTYYDQLAPNKVNVYRITDLVQHLKGARAMGISEYLISVWSPPASLKVPARTEGRFWRLKNNGSLRVEWFPGIENCDSYERVTTSLRADCESEFVEFYAKAIKYLMSQGLAAPVAISLQNEPLWSPDYDGCLYSAAQYHRVVIALRDALNKNGLSSVKVIGPETNDYGDKTWGNPIMWKRWSALDKSNGLPNALSLALQGTAVHSYDLTNDSYWTMDYIDEYAASINRLRSLFPSYDFWATEHSIDYNNSLSEMGLTFRAIRQFNREIALLPHNYWFWWQGYNTDNETSHIQALLTGTDANLKRSKLYYVLSRLWRSAPKGSVVRRVTTNHPLLLASGNAEIDLVAFEKMDENIVLMVCNPTASVQPVTLLGLTSSSAKVYQTTAYENMVNKPDVGVVNGQTTYSLPPESIVILDCAGHTDGPASDKINALLLPASVLPGSSVADLILDNTTNRDGCTFWAGVYDSNWILKGGSGGGIDATRQLIKVSYAGLVNGPANFWVALKSSNGANLAEAAGQSPLASNIVQNPGFENGDSNWNVYGATAIVSYPKKSGVSSLQILAATETNGFYQMLTGIRPSATYNVKVWVRGSASNSPFSIGVSGTGGIDGRINLAVGTSFSEYSFSFSTGVSPSNPKIWGWCGNGSTGVALDDIDVTRN